MKDQHRNAGIGLFVLLVACALLCVDNGADATCAPGTILDIHLGDLMVDQFSYIPTRRGFEFGYTLPNGTHREEIGELINAYSSPEEIRLADSFSRNKRPSRRPGVKNRKLSPRALSSLAG